MFFSKVSVIFFGVLLVSTDSVDPQAICTQLLSLDCTNYTPIENDESVCGTDGVHYDNYCMFGQARCVDPTIDIMKVGHCHTGTTHPPHVITTAPTTTTTMDYQMQLVCANAALITCTNEISLICGSDYKLYQNSCKFTLAMCSTSGLHQLTLDDCRNHNGK
ncbi:ovomucoid-like [Crassostrea angulata]|uniref:ovomucoid-like n=1 Tax=Magallana angulata TaxID=2784310 RepID=UPI0022B087A3|nr:ovomucoid-like [Crassostrea angulata]